MTLIVGCLTHDFVIQVSDRRITRLGTGTILEDTRNKGTVYCAQMAFAYSGLAKLDGKPTDEWLAYALAPAPSLNEALPLLRERATETLARITLPPRAEAPCVRRRRMG